MQSLILRCDHEFHSWDKNTIYDKMKTLFAYRNIK